MRWENKTTCRWPVLLVISVPKNLSKRTVLLQLIIKNVVTCFLEHSVYTYTFSTSRDPRLYTTLLNVDVLNFLPNTGFLTVRLLRFGVKMKRAYCRDDFLAYRPLPGVLRQSGCPNFMFQQDGAQMHREHKSERESREKRRRR